MPYIGRTVIRMHLRALRAHARHAARKRRAVAAGARRGQARRHQRAAGRRGRGEPRQSSARATAWARRSPQSGLFPPLLVEMIRVGERSGEVEAMLERVADTYEREVEHSLNQMTTLLEPLMTLAMAGDYRVHDAGGADANLPAQPVDASERQWSARTMNPTQRRRKLRSGFTLIEIMVVILILGLLATIVVQSLAAPPTRPSAPRPRPTSPRSRPRSTATTSTTATIRPPTRA